MVKSRADRTCGSRSSRHRVMAMIKAVLAMNVTVRQLFFGRVTHGDDVHMEV